MSTVTTPTRSRNLAEAHQRVRSPLERLRRFIRSYVSLEGAAVVGLYLTLWFWIGLVLDYGVFRLFHFDWVQETTWGVRCGVLVVLLSGLAAAAALAVVTRLFREFRDTALALVLERRYPQILGDRLITAVELADPRKAAEIGYSPAMVQETIHEAAQRVEQLKIKEVFDWRRLFRRGILIGVLALGGYFLAVGLFCTANAVQGRGFTAAGFTQFHDVAGLWFERDILLHNVIWPRQAHLEYLDPLPVYGEYRIGRGDRGPAIRVRALKHVIAGAPTTRAIESYRAWLDSCKIEGDEQNQRVARFQQKPAEGWRALSWFDLTPELLGASVPNIALPDDWKEHDPGAGLTLDEIELNLDKSETHKTLAAETKAAMREVLEQLDSRAADPALSRTLRKLTIPEEALLIYKGNTTSSQTTMLRLADNEYTGQFGDLKETVTFTVQGLDYYTAPRKIVVVDPPVLERLLREEERPAYLYYRLGRDDNPSELSGKKQRFEPAQVSLQGGEVSPIYVPVGTNLTLTATASKDLDPASIKIEPHKLHKAGIPLLFSPPRILDERTFSTRFDNVRFEQNFLFRFVDIDGVTGQRQVVIIPSEDAPPKIREFAPDKIVRRVQGGYMATVSARIPFLAEVDDDHGLNEVHYAYTISQAESGRLNRRAAWPLLGGANLNPAAQGTLPGLIDLAYLLHLAEQGERKTEEGPVQRYALPSFRKELDKRPEDAVQHPDAEELASPKTLPYRRLLSRFSIKPDDWTQPELDPLGSDLPLWKTNSNLKMTDPSRPQPRYQMQLWLEAVDNDLDSDKTKDGRPRPHLKVSEERYTFFLVSENELLTEIAKEEEQLYVKLDERYQTLLESQNKLAQVNLDLSSSAVKAEQLGAMSARTDQILEMLEKAQGTTREVYADYARILHEMKANQISERFLDRVEKTIVDPLKQIDGPFESTNEAVANFRKTLDGKEIEPSRKTGKVAKEQMLELTKALEKILLAMQKMTDLNAVIKILAEIEKTEAVQYDTISKIHQDKVNELFEQGEGSGKPERKK
ncbi:MAG: hypothetical protein ACYC3I_21445 [Gemmataceae bacterium]